MEDIIGRFPHIAKQIFEKLDNKSLTNCRVVSKSWQEFIDNRKLLWIRIVEIPTRKGKSTYLKLAFKTGQINVLKTILEKRRDDEILKKLLLRLACEYSNTSAAEWLIKNSLVLDIDLKNAEGDKGGTALHTVCYHSTRYQYANFAKFLIQNSTANYYGIRCQHTKLVELLIRNSATFNIDLNAKDRFHQTAFYQVCSYGNQELIELFIQNSKAYNIDLNAKDTNGWTALHLVCERGQTKVAELLIQKSAEFNINLNANDKKGNTPFDLARHNKHSDIVKLMKNTSSHRRKSLTVFL